MKLLLVLLVTSLLSVSTLAQETPMMPTNLAPRQWLVLGMFPNEEAPVGAIRPGLDREYLAELGGESKARVTPDTSFQYDGRTVGTRKVSLDDTDMIDFIRLYETDTDLKVVYAYAEFTSPVAQALHASFGSDDAAAVWVNGERVHRAATPGRMAEIESDRFSFPVNTGTNRILVKVENGGGGWAFGLRLYDDAGMKQARAMEVRRNLEQLDAGPETGSFIITDSFPTIVWRSSAARTAFGDNPIRVRWFDPELNEAKRPEKPGRYTAVIEAETVDGRIHRQMLTFAKVRDRSPADMLGYGEMPRITLPWNELHQPAPSDAAQDELSRHTWNALREYFWRSEGGAIAAVALDELSAQGQSSSGDPAWLQDGMMRNAEHQLRLRMKLDGRSPKALAPVEVMSSPAPELRDGSESEAGLKPGTVEALRAVCSEWIKDDPNGFVVLVARRGVVVMHEGFGGYGPDQTFRPASIGKAIAGLTIGRAIDQGLIKLDEPVGNVLPDWKDERTKDVTFRHLFNHIAGLRFHASHNGLYNPYLDNALAVQEVAFEQPLRSRRYNGDGYNLAGKALELTSGQTMWRILHETMQKPFGEPVSQYDLGFGHQFNARYLAKVGQMVLQDGQYGPYRFYSPGFVKTLFPRRVGEFAPELNDQKLEWGVGFEWMIDPPSVDRDKGPLGPNVIGHGSATASVWRIAPDHDLVVVIGRNEFKDWAGTATWAAKFMKALAAGLEK